MTWFCFVTPTRRPGRNTNSLAIQHKQERFTINAVHSQVNCLSGCKNRHTITWTQLSSPVSLSASFSAMKNRCFNVETHTVSSCKLFDEISQAFPNPTIPATFSVPPLSPNSCSEPPYTMGVSLDLSLRTKLQCLYTHESYVMTPKGNRNRFSLHQ